MSIGVLGGGQLGRMLALAGSTLGERFVFFDPSRDACAGHVGELLVSPYEDTERLAELARRTRVVTFEFENVAVPALRYLSELTTVYPPPRALEVSQDRLDEKRFFERLAIPTTRYRTVDSVADLVAAGQALGFPLVVKTRRHGYDGKGQLVVHDASQLAATFDALGAVPLIAEEHIPFTREVSAIAARSPSGEMVVYPLFENVHEGGVLRFSIARFDDPLQATAEQWLKIALADLDYVGVLTVEFFERDGGLLANEMAPRVHNSGHLTLEGHDTSQFHNHVRAVLDLPLGRAAPRCHAAMLNLLGDVEAARELCRIPGAHVHVYGKAASPGRKCGHVTLVADTALELRSRVEAAGKLVNPALATRLLEQLSFG